MVRRIRGGEVSSLELVEAAIERIGATNLSLNAVARMRCEEARQEARLADAAVDKSAPFHGVPCSVKEAFAVRGMPNCAGLVALRHRVAAEDAEAVARLRRAGFIVVCVSNTSELCMWCESHNAVYGRTSSCVDVALTSGGSSGGEGALVGAACVPVGLGSDIGGSIRIPALFNGTFGHKPTAGLVSNAGQFPVATGEANEFLCTGPICRRAEDLWPVMNVLSPRPLADPSSVALRTVRVLSIETLGIWPLHPPAEAVAAQRDVVQRLAALGCACTTLPPLPAMSSALALWSVLLQQAEEESFGQRLFQDRNAGAGRALRELLWMFLGGSSPHTLPALALALGENVSRWVTTRAKVRALRAQRDSLRMELERLLGGDGVLIFPSFATLPPLHSQALWWPIGWVYTALMNVLGVPATQVPLGLSREGRPLGVQVVASRNCDHLCFAVAIALDRKQK